ncbi:hypothetical protein KSS87_023648 [Heliosperma pusillum]|nr:hypothetical protein KSS87_023648 [Heliosperma pusillum]
METMNILHMTKGDGEFSYSHNSNSQNRVFSYVIKPLLESSVKSILSNEEMRPMKVMNVADLGCGVGPTPVSLISTVTRTVHNICKELEFNGDDIPQLRIFMSDLPSNDFNLLFKEVIDGQSHDGHNENGKPSCFVMGAPGSFYGRLFPCNSLQLVFSNYAIHWLSQVPRDLYDEVGVPMNKGKIVASDTSHPQVLEAYYDQFQEDFTKFLKCRSNEVVANGYMGIIEEEKLDTFNLPVYFPCKEEIKEIVSKEGSFAIEHLEVVYDDVQNEIKNAELGAEFLAKVARSINESLISYHFGAHVWDDLYDVLYKVIFNNLEADVDPSDIFNIVIVLRKKDD